MKASIDHDLSMADIYRRDPHRAQESLIDAFKTWSYEESAILLRQLVLAFPAGAEKLAKPTHPTGNLEEAPSLDSIAGIFARLGLQVAITPTSPALAEKPVQAAQAA